MQWKPDGTLEVSPALLEQLREGSDLGFELYAVEPREPGPLHRITVVRCQVPGTSLVSTLSRHLLAVRLVALPADTVPRLRWEPPDPRFVKGPRDEW